jgi:TATA-box binding protein (TBP) (component of TFIID and TFIIIB)
MDDIESAWSKFCDEDLLPNEMNDAIESSDTAVGEKGMLTTATEKGLIPKCSLLNISTKTKISYLNVPIDLKEVFWKIPVVTYHEPNMGVVKKQMKFNSTTPEEVSEIIQHKAAYDYIDDYVISQINNPDGRTKFKDIRKISIGICKKDITSYRCKRKSAFYNCFVVILRLLHNDLYKEIHVKVFNTGKLEIPGIQDSTILDKVLTLLVSILSPIIIKKTAEELPLKFLEDKSETVMINSNFRCGYYINREKLYKLLKYKYKINSNFDPCSYPGIQCEFYYDTLILNDKDQHGVQPSLERSGNQVALPVTKVSFMIFRTGSVLIVGKCSEEMLYQIYEFLCNIFETEYDEIKWLSNEPTAAATNMKSKDKTRKMRKKLITV